MATRADRPTKIELRTARGQRSIARRLRDGPPESTTVYVPAADAAPYRHEDRQLVKVVLFGAEFHFTDPFSDGTVVLAGQWSERDRAALLLTLQGLYDLGVWPKMWPKRVEMRASPLEDPPPGTPATPWPPR